MCTLASRMVKLRRITATFFVTTGFYDRVLAEIKRDFLPAEEHLFSLVRSVCIFFSLVVATHRSL